MADNEHPSLDKAPARVSDAGRSPLEIRLATPADADALRGLIRLATEQLQHGFLSAKHIAASHRFMGLDTMLIEDGTYYVVECDGRLAGCGGWGCRATPHGGDDAEVRDDRLLDPLREPARIRAMYTHPDFTRRGIGRLILTTSEQAAMARGFSNAIVSATLAGEPLYRSAGYREVDRFTENGVPIVHLEKDFM